MFQPPAPDAMPEDMDARRGLFEQARVAIQLAGTQGNTAEVKKLVAWAWDVADLSQSTEERALAHWCSGIALFERESKAALTHLEAACEYHRNSGLARLEGRILIGCAGLLGRLNRLPEAEKAIQRAIDNLQDWPDYRGWPDALLNYADIRWRQGDIPGMLKLSLEAADKAVLFERVDIQVMALINQSVAMIDMKCIAEAETTLKQADELAQNHDFPDLRGRIALNRARLMIDQGSLLEGMTQLHQARCSFHDAEMLIDEANVLLEEARLLDRLFLSYDALDFARRAVERFKEAGLGLESIEAALLTVRLALSLGETIAAQTMIQQLQELNYQGNAVWKQLLIGYVAHPLINPTNKQHQALFQAEIAAAALDSLKAVEQALEVKLIAADVAAIIGLPDLSLRYASIAAEARLYELPAIELYACERQACYEPRPQAIESLRHAAALARVTQRRMPIEELKATLLTGRQSLYGHLFEEEVLSNQSQAAFKTIIEAKGGIWMELLAPSVSQDIPSDIIRLRNQLGLWRDKLYDQANPAIHAVAHKSIIDLEQELVRLSRQDVRLRPILPLPTPDTIQAAIPDDAVVIEFCEGRSALYACILKHNNEPHWQYVTRLEPLKDRIRRIDGQIKLVQYQPTPEVRLRAAQANERFIIAELEALSDMLLTPLLPWLTSGGTIIIVPDTILYGVPWAALRWKGRYLAQAVILTILPSSALLAIHSTIESSKPSGYPIILGYPGKAERHLKVVKDEIDAIGNLFPNCRTEISATHADLTWDVAPSILHLAAHGQIHQHAALLSSLDLADGPLLLADVLRLSLHGTRLVTLSACETGVAPEYGGIILALAGAFLCAGTESVVSTLWQVDDHMTAHFMTNFYTAITAGKPLSHALNQAQQSFLDGSHTHPYYWAAFQSLSRTLSTLTRCITH